jgi:hypothetical protein
MKMEEHSGSHDEIHLPSPSIAPLVVAAGLALTLVGLLTLPLLVIGVVTLVAGIAMWVLSPT